jgi:ABC-2 type transport system ATP-binding protein
VRSAQPEKLEAALTKQELTATASGDQVLLVHGATSERVGEIAFAAGVPVHELVTEGSSLEEIFLELTAEGES